MGGAGKNTVFRRRRWIEKLTDRLFPHIKFGIEWLEPEKFLYYKFILPRRENFLAHRASLRSENADPNPFRLVYSAPILKKTFKVAGLTQQLYRDRAMDSHMVPFNIF